MHLSRASLRTLTSSCKTVLPISHSSKALPTMHLTTIHPRIIICVSSLWVGIPFRAVSQVFLSPCLTLNLWNTLRIDSYWFSVTPPFFQLLEIPIQKTNQLIYSSSSEREQEYVLPKRRGGRHTQRGAAPSAAAICTSSECRRPASLPASQPCCPILPPSRSEDHRISRATQRPWLPLQNQWHHDARYKLLFHLIRSKGVWKRKLTSLSWKGQRFVLPLKFPANWILCQLYKGAFHKINVSVWKILLRRGCWLTSENEKGNRFFFFFTWYNIIIGTNTSKYEYMVTESGVLFSTQHLRYSTLYFRYLFQDSMTSKRYSAMLLVLQITLITRNLLPTATLRLTTILRVLITARKTITTLPLPHSAMHSLLATTQATPTTTRRQRQITTTTMVHPSCLRSSSCNLHRLPRNRDLPQLSNLVGGHGKKAINAMLATGKIRM